MKKHKTEKKYIFKKWWITLGLIIFIWTAFWFVKTRILNEYAFIINVIFLVIGYALLINYALITAVYWAVKRLKKEWEIRD
jgi:hypothetical protein